MFLFGSFQVLLALNFGCPSFTCISEKGGMVAKKLESVNIIVDCGVRLGVNELMRRGMQEEEMQTIAQFIEKWRKMAKSIKKLSQT